MIPSLLLLSKDAVVIIFVRNLPARGTVWGVDTAGTQQLMNVYVML